MARRKKENRILTVIIVLLALILSLGLLSRITGGIGEKAEIAVTYQGKKYTNSSSGLKVAPGAEFDVRLRDEKEDYEVKIYATGTTADDFLFTVDGAEYSWYNDVVSANDGKGEEFTDIFEITKTEKGFTISGGVEKVLTDIWKDSEIVLPEDIPNGDKFRMEIIYGKTTVKLEFDTIDEYSGVNDVTITPGGIIF